MAGWLMRPSNSLIISNGTSGTASYVSSVVWGWDIVRFSVQVTVGSGSVVGTFQMQGSNDIATGLPPNQFQPTNWNNIGTASVVASSSATALSFLIVTTESSYEYLRLRYADSSAGAALGLFNARFKAMAL